MIKIIIVTLMLTAASALGAPFLVSDPYIPQSDPNLNPVNFIINGIGTSPVNSPAYRQPSTGNLMLSYDLANLANGKYTVTAQAVNVFGGTSLASAPFSFTKGSPATPAGLKIVPTRPQ